MIQIFYGPNAFTKEEKLRGIITELKKIHSDLAVRTFFIADSNLEELSEFLLSGGLFGAEKKIAIVKDIQECQDTKALKDLFLRVQDDKECALYVNGNWRGSSIPKKVEALFKDIKIKKICFKKQSEREMIAALHKNAVKRGVKIEKKAVELLFTVYEKNPYAVLNEIIKLSFLKKEIRQKDLLSHRDYSNQVSLFAFSKTLLSQASLAQKLSALEELISQKPEYVGVLNYMTKVAKEPKTVKNLANADIKIKSGLLEPEQALLEVALS